MSRRDLTQPCKMPLDVRPCQPLAGLFHRDDDATCGGGSFEHHLTAPNDGALLPVRVDPECVTTNRDFLGGIAAANGKHARMKPGQTRDEARLLRVQVFEHDALVIPKFVELLIGRGAVEKRRIDIFGQRMIAEVVPRKCRGMLPETIHAARPRRSNGAISNRGNHVVS